MDKAIALVGSSGPLGLFLNDYFLLQGWSVRRIGRSGAPGVVIADVRRGPQSGVYGDSRAVVYCAWNTRDRSAQEQLAHVNAAAKWARFASSTGRTFLFTSTVAAGRGTVSSYGRHKAMAEEAICESGGVALRMGLVVDDAYPFLATMIRNTTCRHPYLAMALDLPVFAVSTATVALAIAAEIEEPRHGERIWLAPTEPTSLGSVVSWGRGWSGRAVPVLRCMAAGSSALVRVGLGGRYLDALAGLRASGSARDQSVLVPHTGPVGPDDWQRCLIAPAGTVSRRRLN